jgi:hypothetical protein
MEQGQQLGRAVTDVLMWLVLRMPLASPAMTRIRYRLEGPGFAAAPYRQAERFADLVGLLDQLFSAGRLDQ